MFCFVLFSIACKSQDCCKRNRLVIVKQWREKQNGLEKNQWQAKQGKKMPFRSHNNRFHIHIIKLFEFNFYLLYYFEDYFVLEWFKIFKFNICIVYNTNTKQILLEFSISSPEQLNAQYFKRVFRKTVDIQLSLFHNQDWITRTTHARCTFYEATT